MGIVNPMLHVVFPKKLGFGCNKCFKSGNFGCYLCKGKDFGDWMVPTPPFSRVVNTME